MARPRKDNTKFMLDGAMPIDGNGVLALPKQPGKEMVDHFYDIRGIQQEHVQEILTEKFYDFIQAICDGDEAKIESIAEKRFAQKIFANLEKIR